MVRFRVGGVTVAVDVSAPAWLAFLSLRLDIHAFAAILLACVLHEGGHLLAMYALRRRPELLRVSAAGLQLTFADALCPAGALCAIVLAGPCANLLAAAALAPGLRRFGAAQLAMALFNLLPYRGTDGGTLLRAGLEQVLAPAHLSLAEPIARGFALLTSALLAALLLPVTPNLSLWGMVIFLTISELKIEN